MSVTLDITTDSPYVAGHFPGRPILPGIAQIVLALEAIAREAGRPLTMRRLAQARFRRLVAPPGRLELSARPSGDASFRVEASCDGAPVAGMEIETGEPEAAADWQIAVASRRVTSAPPIEALLPHRPPMRFVEAIVGEAEDGLTCEARVPEACALSVSGSVPAIAALEAAAQTAAVWEALRRTRAGERGDGIGFLVSARDVVLYETTLSTDAPLVATARLAAHAGPLAHYRVEVSCATRPVLRGTLGAYLEGQSVRKQNH